MVVTLGTGGSRVAHVRYNDVAPALVAQRREAAAIAEDERRKARVREMNAQQQRVLLQQLDERERLKEIERR